MPSIVMPVNENFHPWILRDLLQSVGPAMNKLCRIVLCLPLLLGVAGWSLTAAEFWVSPNGSDTNAATPEHPLASVNMALRQARELRRRSQVATNEPVKIILRGGVYPLTSPLLFRPEDSGTEASPTLIEAAPGEKPVLSGGVPVTGWRRVTEKIPGLSETARGVVWVADAPKFGGRVLETRQLWVNSDKAIRAREPNGDNLNRLLGWDRRREEAWVPAALVKSLHDASRLEMVIHQQWEIAVCRVKSLERRSPTRRDSAGVQPAGPETGAPGTESADRVCVTFQQPESKIEFAHPWPQPVMSTHGNAPFYLVNALDFLDEPGEWFQEMPGGKIYYWPRGEEDLAKAEVIAPALETLVKVDGSLDQPVAQVQFKGIAFAHSTWMRPAEVGHVPLQAGMFLLDAYKLSPKGTAYHRGLDNLAWIGRPPAAVFVRGANHVGFARCRFEHLASAGLDFASGTQDDLIEGCVFRDIGGNGIQLGKFSDENVETHVPYTPTDEREICSREKISNNLVTDCANEDWGCVGICVGYGREISIEHNDVNHVSYTGISVGWGWTKATNCLANNRIVANHVHHVATRMCDTAGIYTLSAQPGTVVAENSVHDIEMSPYVSDPEHWFYLYLDEGSSFITVRDNWCPEEKFLKNANGPGNVWENNGPNVSKQIKDAAGLEPTFRDLLGR